MKIINDLQRRLSNYTPYVGVITYTYATLSTGSEDICC